MSKIIRRFEDLSTPLVAIITAGGRYDPNDPLLQPSGARHKALIPIAGKPLIMHVTQALADSGYVARVIVVGLEQEWDLELPLPTTFVPAPGSILENIMVGLAELERVAPGAERVLMCACDVPLVTGNMVRYLVDTALSTGADVCYTVVRRETMEARFPGSGRSFVHLLDGHFAGGDMNLLTPAIFEQNRALLDSLLGARKSALTQARLIGLRFLLKFLLRRLSIAEGERKAQSILGVPCRIIPVRYAELGMDVDKPHQLELVRAEMEGQSR
jgi:molybdopterin-guanine dinucleotide biosynthesis protein A